MAVMEILVGPIASGKSTYCRKRAQEGAIVINDDSVVMCFHGGNYKQYKPELKSFYKSIEHVAIHMALAMGLDVVIDRPCFRRSTRQRYIELARSVDVPANLLVFKREAPEVHATRRYMGDARGYTYDYWLNVAQIHDSQWEEPDVWVENANELIDAEPVIKELLNLSR